MSEFKKGDRVYWYEMNMRGTVVTTGVCSHPQCKSAETLIIKEDNYSGENYSGEYHAKNFVIVTEN